jgi:glycosyltransferase involved in cell wall biosynthesis
MSDAAVTASPEPRVLHVDDQRTWRGGEQQMFYLARGLQRRGVETACVVQKGAAGVEKLSEAALTVHELPMHGEADLVAAWRIARIARRGGYNILHSHTSHAHSLVSLARNLWRAPCKVVVHRRIEFPVGKGLFGLGALKYRHGVDAYIAISNRLKDTLSDAGVAEWRVFVVRSATDPSRFVGVRPDPGLRASLGIPDDAFVVGNVAMLVGHKDHRTLLEACRVVRDSVPQTWVVIVGSGPLRDSIVDKADAMHMDERLVMTGWREDVPRLIRMFDVFALSSSEEGMCSTLAEVAVSGCPIVATDAGGVREVVLPEKTGIVVPIKSPRALAEGVLRLHENPALARQFVEAGKMRILAQFTDDVLAERTLDVYGQVLGGQVGPEHPVGYLQE